MANANSGTPRNSVIHGAAAYLIVNGKKVGYVTNVSYQQTMNMIPIDVLDNVRTEEFALSSVSYSGSIGRVEVFGSTTTEAGLTVPIEQAFTAPGMNLAFIYSPRGAVYRTLIGVRITGKGIDLSKGAQSVANLTFVCTSSQDANGITEI